MSLFVLRALRLEQGGEAGGCSGLRVASGKSPLRCGRLEGPARGPGPLGGAEHGGQQGHKVLELGAFVAGSKTHAVQPLINFRSGPSTGARISPRCVQTDGNHSCPARTEQGSDTRQGDVAPARKNNEQEVKTSLQPLTSLSAGCREQRPRCSDRGAFPKLFQQVTKSEMETEAEMMRNT